MSSPFTCINLLAALAFCLLLPLAAQAAQIETLVMPGPLIEGHAEKESECTQCHSRFSPKAQNNLCLNCHDKVADDIKAATGFHGKMQFSDSDSCALCHTDHKGRKANIVNLDRELFNHDKTDFPLRGGHNNQRCESCHESGKRWREAPSECHSCHKKQDVHKGRLGTDCASCHTPQRWLQQRFDHSKTDFPLRGAHENTQCSACHPNQTYKNIPTQCNSCHAGNDVHRAGYGTQCATCHTPERWKSTRFDHDKTRFHLQGAHADTACSSCHAPAVKAQGLTQSCNSCHAVDDVHRGRNGQQCADCHNSQSWKKTLFNHNKDTQFHLAGAHADAACNSCHAGGVKKNARVRECKACHNQDDAHDGKMAGDCASCHKPSGWNNDTRFDHDLTGMPLYGMHALATCESCHKNNEYVPLPLACDSCHSKQDKHKGALGSACGSCHNANDWKLWNFNHDRTDFPLSGKHNGLTCASCHQQAPASATPQACISCHQADDVHQGGFGRNCERCHSSDSFNHILNQPLRGGRE